MTTPNAEDSLDEIGGEWGDQMRVALLVMGLRRQLEAAHKCIGELRKELVSQTLTRVAEQAFGYTDTRPATSWVRGDRPFMLEPTKFRKVNTEVLEVATFVADELLEMHRDSSHLEDQIKRNMMDDLFCRMQELGLFRQFERKVNHETVYVMGIEVARKS